MNAAPTMTEAEYRALDAVNWSTLKVLWQKSPLHYRHALSAPHEDSDTLALGRLRHTLCFEPERFEEEYAVWTGKVRAGGAWEEFQREHAAKTIVRPQDIATARSFAAAFRAHPEVAEYLDGAEFERCVTWTDGLTGLPCKGRLDWTNRRRSALLDLKSTADLDRRRFGLTAARLGYHYQLMHYADGCAHALGWTPERLIIVAVESAPPHDIAVLELDPDTRHIAATGLRDMLAKLADCRARNHWPGRYPEPEYLQLPAYVFGDEDEETADDLGLTAAG